MFAQRDKQTNYHSFCPNMCIFVSLWFLWNWTNFPSLRAHLHLHLARKTPKSANVILTIWDVGWYVNVVFLFTNRILSLHKIQYGNFINKSLLVDKEKLKLYLDKKISTFELLILKLVELVCQLDNNFEVPFKKICTWSNESMKHMCG